MEMMDNFKGDTVVEDVEKNMMKFMKMTSWILNYVY